MDRLLWDDALSAAQRQIALTKPGKRDYFQARLALRMKWPDAAPRLAAVWSPNPRDSGLIAAKARRPRQTGDRVGPRRPPADSQDGPGDAPSPLPTGSTPGGGEGG